MRKTFGCFRVPGIEKTDVDVYIAMVRPNIKILIEEQVKDMESAKVQLSIWIMWKKKTVAVEPDALDLKGEKI